VHSVNRSSNKEMITTYSKAIDDEEHMDEGEKDATMVGCMANRKEGDVCNAWINFEIQTTDPWKECYCQLVIMLRHWYEGRTN
jgi:hypothetical protein